MKSPNTPLRYTLFGTQHVSTIPLFVRRQLRALTFRDQSLMKQALAKIVEGTWPGTIVYCLDEERVKVLSWGLIVWKNSDSPEIMLYTRISSRGQGLAKEVFWSLRHTLPIDAHYTYYPHNKAVHDFYMRRFEERVSGTMPTPDCLWVRQ